MLVRDFVYIGQPFESVAPKFVQDPQWLDPLVARAAGTPTGHCQRGIVRHHDDTLVVPIHWVVEGPVAFRTMEGDLVIAPMGPDECQIAFAARYVTSNDEVGRGGRETRTAEAAIRAFLDGLAAALNVSS